MAWYDFGLKSSSNSQDFARNIFPMPISQGDFTKIDLLTLYKRILTDCFERTQGIEETKQMLLWDNCLASEKQDGLITMIAEAMLKKSELFLIYDSATNVIRKATQAEENQIKADYKKTGESSLGIYITFKNYITTDIMLFYSMLEYCNIGSLWKLGNVSKALQLKFNDLRGSTSLTDSADLITQAKLLAKGLADGNDIMLDAKDILELLKPDLTANVSMQEFIDKKRSLYLGLPATYLSGDTTKGISDTGKSDSKAVERGLRGFYYSICKPLIDGIFKITTTFKSDDSEMLAAALETLKTMDLTTEEYLSKENKQLVVSKAFGFDSV